MKVKVKFFLSHLKAAGKAEVEIELKAGSSVNALQEELIGRFPRLEKLKKYTILLVNQKQAKGEELLKAGDVVMLFPPISGG